MTSPGAAITAFLLALSLSGGELAAQPTQAGGSELPTLALQGVEPISVMVLGVFHFHNPNADHAQFKGIDVLSDQRQQEIESVVSSLAAFGPSQVAVEAPVAEKPKLDADYAAYRSGDFQLTANEIHQVGFRLAERLDLPGVDPVDYRMGLNLGEFFAYLEENDPEFSRHFRSYVSDVETTLDAWQAGESIGRTLRLMNSPDALRRTHEPYAVMAGIGADSDHLGARISTRWYERNLRIFANLAEVAEPGGRIILIVGAGHAPLIRHLVTSHPEMALVEPNDYLDEEDAHPDPDIYVANLGSGTVSRFDGESGAALGAFDHATDRLQGATGLAFGPDGNLYVASSGGGEILRYDGETGRFIDVFVDDPALGTPFSIIFGPGGDLFVSSGSERRVFRFAGSTGEMRGIAALDEELGQPIGLAFDGDGRLYVANPHGRNILQFDPDTGRLLRTIGSELNFVSDIVFGTDGRLYASAAASGQIIEIDPITGEASVYGQLPEGAIPVGVAFDRAGRLFVADFGNSRLYRIDAAGAEPRLLAAEHLDGPENLVVRGAPR